MRRIYNVRIYTHILFPIIDKQERREQLYSPKTCYIQRVTYNIS